MGWIYGLFSDKPGNFVKKPMRECTGREICMEWLYHMGVPEGEIAELAAHSANTVPCMMPYITAFFLPRATGDRPRVVPDGAVNFAFLGQFAETERDTIFTTEYSMRTGMEAVYTLLDIDRGVPEVWGSTYDVRDLINASVQLRDGRKLTELELNPAERLALKAVLKNAPWHRPGEAAPGLPRHLTRPAPALSKSAGARCPSKRSVERFRPGPNGSLSAKQPVERFPGDRHAHLFLCRACDGPCGRKQKLLTFYEVCNHRVPSSRQ